jgi:hypothetical protein
MSEGPDEHDLARKPPVQIERPLLPVLKESLDLLEARLTRANGHWTFLFTLDLAVVGWLISRVDPIPKGPKLVLSAILVLAYAFILRAIHAAQREMIFANEEIKNALHNQVGVLDKPFREYLLARSFRKFPQITVPLFIVGNGVVLWFLWAHPL